MYSRGERVGRRAILKAGISLGILLSFCQESPGQENGAFSKLRQLAVSGKVAQGLTAHLDLSDPLRVYERVAVRRVISSSELHHRASCQR